MSIYSKEAIQEIIQKLDPVQVLLLIDYRPETIQDKGGQIKCFCPIHKEAVFRTLLLNREDKNFRCSYSLCPGGKGGDLIQLYALSKGFSYDDAAGEIVKELGLDVELPTAQAFLADILREAETYLEMEVPDAAETAFRQAVAAAPNDPAALSGLIRALQMGGKHGEAREYRLTLMDAALNAGDNESACEALDSYLLESPDDDKRRLQLVNVLKALGRQEEQATHYMVLAERYEAAGEVDNALRMYRSVEALNIGVLDVLPYVSNLLLSAGRRVEAVDEHLKHADELEAEGLHDAALECLDQALEIDPEREDVRARAIDGAAARALSGDLLDKALRWADGYIERDALPEALDALERLHLRAPRDERVLERMIGVLRLQGKQAEVNALQARLAEEQASSGDWKGALKRIESALKDSPGALPLIRQKAELLKANGQNKPAVEAYRELVEILSRDQNLGDLVAACDSALALSPDDLELAERRYLALSDLGDPAGAARAAADLADRWIARGSGDKALDLLDQAIALDPGNPSMLLRKAVAAEQAGRNEDALAARLKAAEQHMAANRFNEAVPILETALKQAPKNEEALDKLAACLEQLGESARAVKALDDLASALEKKEDYSRADAVLRRMIKIDEGHLGARVRLADVLRQLGRVDDEIVILQQAAARALQDSTYSKAEQYCRRILERRPNHVFALETLIQVCEATKKAKAMQDLLMRLADVHSQAEDRARERAVYERILERWPAHFEARRRFLFLLWDLQDVRRMETEARGLIEGLLKLRRFEEAEKIVQELRAKAPDEPQFLELAAATYEQWAKSEEWNEAARQLADLYRRRGMLGPAADWTARLIERNPTDEGLRADRIGLLLRDERGDEAAAEYVALAGIHTDRGAWADAMAAYRATLELSPGHDQATRALIRLCIQQNAHDEALSLIQSFASAQEHREEYDEAIATLRMAFEVDRDSLDTRRRIIDILRAKGEAAESAAELDNLITLQQSRENWEDVAELLQEKISLMPDDPSPREALVDLWRRLDRREIRFEEEIALAQFYVDHEACEAAIAILDRIIQEDTNSVRARRLRAGALARVGDEKRALAEFLRISTHLEELAAAPRAAIDDNDQERAKLAVVKDYNFDRFVVGPRNNFAYATALAVAKSPGHAYNPLFIYSDVGLGKTHLLHSIANFLMQRNPAMKIIYTSVDEFTDELVEAIESNSVKQFRARHKSTDVLLIDDIQFLAGKERAQEEFFHIFNTLFQSQRQIAITSDRPPKEMDQLEKRLVSRFGAGMVVDIQPPDLETRSAIIQREMKQVEGMEFPENFARILAQRLESNIRDLKGAFNQCIALALHGGEPLTEDSVGRILEQIVQKI